MSSISDSHYKHRDEWQKQATDPRRRQLIESWFRIDTADYWRHSRMYEGARAFLHDPSQSWLTVGDGRFGLDAIRLGRLGFISVLPSDIGDALLKEAKSRGLIENYAIENAEFLTFDDDSFDLVLCKESYHHFPRPAVALYEMLRVARKAVVLIEPGDYVIDHGPLQATGPRKILGGLRTWLRDRRRVPQPSLPNEQLYVLGDPPAYEETGNYLYTLSSRELEKICLGINLPALALKGLNDFYAGGESEPADASSEVFHSMVNEIDAADRRTRGGRGATTMLMAVLFKAAPDDETRSFLIQNGWLVRDLPRNPHIGGQAADA